MSPIVAYIKNFPRRQHVRPWAMFTPILVLVVALPLLRPLRRPESWGISSNELTRLAAIQAMAEGHGQVIDDRQFLQILRERNNAYPPQTVRIAGHFYSDKPPVMSKLLSWVYSMLMWTGLSFRNNPLLVTYLLTVIGVTLPAAGAAGLIYRMGRLFDLRRPYRTALALTVCFGSGLISYAVVLNPHVPAATLVLAACACLIHIIASKTQKQSGVWLMVSGFCASLAAVIDLSAGIFLVGLVAVIFALRWKISLRIGGVLLFIIGALPPLALHATLTIPVTGDLLPPYLHHEPRMVRANTASISQSMGVDRGDFDNAEGETPPDAGPGWIHLTATATGLLLGAILGSHGILSHFPVLIFGMIGIGLVLRRHWPTSTKALALVTLVGSILIVLAYVFLRVDWSQRMFGPRWFIVFLPLMLFWAGPWLRKAHHPISWTLAVMALVFSIAVGLLGATDPFVRTIPGRYTAAAALRELFRSQSSRPPLNAVADGG